MPDYNQEELDRIDRGDDRPSTYEQARKAFVTPERQESSRQGATIIQRLGNLARFGRGTDRDTSRKDSSR